MKIYTVGQNKDLRPSHDVIYHFTMKILILRSDSQVSTDASSLTYGVKDKTFKNSSILQSVKSTNNSWIYTRFPRPTELCQYQDAIYRAISQRDALRLRSGAARPSTTSQQTPSVEAWFALQNNVNCRKIRIGLMNLTYNRKYFELYFT